MPIFISYSHKDRDFVDRLAAQLVRHKVHVWLDRWELHVGDSLISKVQAALTDASALLVILSKASVASEWCKKELNIGLVREMEERRVVVLPVLVEDCEIPLFLREKLNADLRHDFDAGLQTILDAVAKVTNEYLGRTVSPQFHTDWAVDWWTEDGLFNLRVTMAEHGVDQPFTVLSCVDFKCDRSATDKYDQMQARAFGEVARRQIIGILASAIGQGLDLTLLLDDQFEQSRTISLATPDGTPSYLIRASARRLGEDTGRSIVYHMGNQIQQIYEHMNAVAQPPGNQPHQSGDAGL